MLVYRFYNGPAMIVEFFVCFRLFILPQKQHQIPAYVLPSAGRIYGDSEKKKQIPIYKTPLNPQ